MNRKSVKFIAVLVSSIFAMSLAACGGGGEGGTTPPAPNIVVTDSVSMDNDLQIPFGSVATGSTSDQTVIVSNTGTADLIIGTIAGPTGPFSITTNCSNQTIAPGGTCTETVQFAPTETGSLNDSFDIQSNDPDTPTIRVSVSGTGTAFPVPDIMVTDSVGSANDHTILFGNVAIGSTSDQTVTVTNTGTADLIIGVPAPFAAPFGIATQNCWGQTIAPNGTCTVTMRFSPIAETTYTGSYDITSNDPDTPTVKVNLNGTGIAPPPSNTPALPLRLPATGQTAAYAAGDDGTLQNGAVWPIPRFTVTYCNATGPCGSQAADCDSNSATDVITDNLTGLMWARSGNLAAGTKIWSDALTYANDLTLCGYTDWGLPNRKELKSIVNYGLTNIHLWLNSQAFSGVLCGKYWSSTTYTWGTNTNHAWVASLCDGTTGFNVKDTPPWYVLPVRGGVAAPAVLPRTGQRECYNAAGVVIACANTGQDGDLLRGIAWPGPRFADNSDGTATDSLTGLVWTKNANAPGPAACAPGVAKTWLGALDYVACLNTNNYLGGGWRLPNINELESLFHSGYKEEICGVASCSDNAAWLGTQGFSNSQIYYWSSSTYAGDTTMAWILRMNEGFVQFDAKSADYYYVWPVR